MLKDIAFSTSKKLNKLNFNKDENFIEKIFNPKTICVVGASNNLNELGGKIFNNLSKNQNIKLFPINVTWEFIQNKKAYINLLSINKKEIDLIIITVNDLNSIIVAIKNSIQINSKNILIMSKLNENDILKLKNEIENLIDIENLNIIGLNSLGFMNLNKDINILTNNIDCLKGDFSLVSTNINELDSIFDFSISENIGFSKILDLGNCDFFSINDCLDYLKNDISTKYIILNVEDKLPKKFDEKILEISKYKKIIIFSKNLKYSFMLNEIIKNTGAIFAKDYEELKNYLIISNSKNDKKINTSIFSISNSKMMSLTFDIKLKNKNIKKYNIDSREVDNLSFLPQDVERKNPIYFKNCFNYDYLENIFNYIKKINVGYIIIFIEFNRELDLEKLSEMIITFSKKTNSKIIVNLFGGDRIKNFINILKNNKIPVFLNQNDLIDSINKINNSYYENIPVITDIYSFDETRINFVKEEIKKYNVILPDNLIFEIFNNILAINIEKSIIINSLFEINDIFLENKEVYILSGVGRNSNSEEIVDKKDIIFDVNFNNFKGKIHLLFDRMFEKYHEFYIKLEKQKKGIEFYIENVESNLGNFIKIGINESNFESEELIKLPTNKSIIKDKISSLNLKSELNIFRGSQEHLNNLYEIINRISNLREIFPELRDFKINNIILNNDGVFIKNIILKK